MLDHLDPDPGPRPRRRWARVVVGLTALLVGGIALGAVPVDVAPVEAVTDPRCTDDGEIATDEVYVPEYAGCTTVVNPAYCYDGLTNTADSGTPETGCVFSALPVGAPCNDLYPETAPDVIGEDGSCSGPIVDGTPCGDGYEAYYVDQVCVRADLEGTACDDGLTITTLDRITQGVCRGIPQCSDGLVTTRDIADLENDRCRYESADGVACDDGDSATINDTVANFECIGEPLPCPDLPGRINGRAVTGVGCVYDFATGPCDDGRSETVDDQWVAGVCVGVLRTGPCDDGSPATVGDVYVNGVCVPGPLRNCSDGDPNTRDVLDMVTGACSNPPLPDGSSCTDGDSTTNSDTMSGGECVGTPIVCDDGNPNTVDTRVPNVGCRSTPLPDGSPCDDGSSATTGDVMVAGVCVGVLRTGPCDDGSPATVGDVYVNGVCVSGPLRNCSDGDPNTRDVLDMVTGACSNPPLPDGSSCTDGDSTTNSDTMSGGECVGTPIVCDDGNPNTIDTRVPNVGCVHTPVVQRCNGLLVTVDLSLGQRPTAGDDVILGTSGPDVIDARGGDDVICGLGGVDVIDAGSGDDTVLAGDGVDLVGGGAGNDRILGGAGGDIVLGERGADVLLGEDGADILLGNDGIDDIDGGAGIDTCGRDQRRDRLVSCTFVIPG